MEFQTTTHKKKREKKNTIQNWLLQRETRIQYPDKNTIQNWRTNERALINFDYNMPPKRSTSATGARKPEEKVTEERTQQEKEIISLEGKGSETVTTTGNINMMEMLKQMMERMEENTKTILEENMKKSEENMKKLQENMNKLNEKMDKRDEEIKSQIAATNESIKKQNEKVVASIEDVIKHNTALSTRIEEMNIKWQESNEKIRENVEAVNTLRSEVATEFQTTNETCRHRYEQITNQNKENINRLTERVGNNQVLCQEEFTRVNEIIHTNKNLIEQEYQRDLNQLREDMDRYQNRPICQASGNYNVMKEEIKFINYVRNPMEYINRLTEFIARNRENRWEIIKPIIDDGFKDYRDNWWDATRHDVNNFEDFKKQFKNRYWSAPIQHQVRNVLINGRYDPNKNMSLSAYFLGKVCLARNLEPAIPEESLVNQLIYHYDERIINARSARQIDTIHGITQLLSNFERDDFYRQHRRQLERGQEIIRRNNNNNNFDNNNFNNNNFNNRNRQINMTYARNNNNNNSHRYQGNDSYNKYNDHYQRSNANRGINNRYQGRRSYEMPRHYERRNSLTHEREQRRNRSLERPAPVPTNSQEVAENARRQ